MAHATSCIGTTPAPLLTTLPLPQNAQYPAAFNNLAVQFLKPESLPPPSRVEEVGDPKCFWELPSPMPTSDFVAGGSHDPSAITPAGA